MKIHEAARQTGLTKKAIRFYEQEGLISPSIDETNGYREYDNEDLRRLVEITLFRRLNIPVKEIKMAMQQPDHVHHLLAEHKSRLEAEMKQMERSKNLIETILENPDHKSEELMSKWKLLSDSIDLDNRQKAGYIREKLLELFPGTYGAMIVHHFEPFLDIQMDSERKEKAWLNIIAYLDETDIEYPPGFEEMFNGMPDGLLEQYKEQLTDDMKKLMHLTKEEEKDYEAKVIEAFKRLTSGNEQAFSEKFKIGKDFKQELSRNGYYDVFIKNFIILSDEYRNYHRFLRRLQKKLQTELPEPWSRMERQE
ncbi:MerR family transcriptional regulator [Paenibacillus caui]|uniref:MerR family transcriptional regulator n=1 Tax=Paenibacillus caui TaxID=2873927 RepID=UPI001CA96687|nr:MerR family transcriptional regulator [Paenibacillus caui]